MDCMGGQKERNNNLSVKKKAYRWMERGQANKSQTDRSMHRDLTRLAPVINEGWDKNDRDISWTMRELSNYLINLEETLSWRQYKEIGEGGPAHSDNTSTQRSIRYPRWVGRQGGAILPKFGLPVALLVFHNFALVDLVTDAQFQPLCIHIERWMDKWRSANESYLERWMDTRTDG